MHNFIGVIIGCNDYGRTMYVIIEMDDKALNNILTRFNYNA